LLLEWFSLLVTRYQSSLTMQQFRLPRLTVPTFTPMTPDGELDLDKIPAYARLLSQSGVRSVFVCGSTGEFPSLSLDERRRVLEAWCQARADGLIDTVTAHVGTCCLKDTILLARHAVQKCNADAVASVAPWYFPIDQIDATVELLAKVAAECDGKPFYYYHIPMFTNSKLDVAQLMRRAAALVPNLVGLKFTDSSLSQLAACSEVVAPDGRQMQAIIGLDDLTLPARSVGVLDGIGASYNLIPDVVNSLADSFDSGNLSTARSESSRIRSLFEAISSAVEGYGMVSLLKITMSLMRMDLGPPRLPLKPLNSPARIILEQRLKFDGFLARDEAQEKLA
ncbi:hypothetical protein BOX15_Mlig017179g1, partial [Macrostomum lignano]